MKKRIDCQKGSTMILIVMAIAIIAILGTSIMGVTMMNYRIKLKNTALKQSFYLSETGLDKAYDEAYALVVDAVNYSNEKVQQSFLQRFTPEYLETLIAESIEASGSYIEHPHVEYSDLELIKDSDGDGNKDAYDDAKIKVEAKEQFEKCFYEYVTEKDSSHDNIVNRLDKIKPNPVVSINKKAKFLHKDGNTFTELTISNGVFSEYEKEKPEMIEEGDVLIIGINSAYEKDDIEKTTSVDLNIKIPQYGNPYTIKTEAIPVNQYWTKMMTARNLYINGNSDFGGEVYVSNNLEMNKDNVTAKFTDKLSVKGEEETFSGGIELNAAGVSLNTMDVYANNIWLNGNGISFISLSDSVGSGVYVRDDLEMNNSEQTVDIKGSYFGFGDGGKTVDNKYNSAIIINSNDIADSGGSRLNIDGDLNLMGTSFIQNLKKYGTTAIYATGESLSIKGNYLAYTMPLTSDEAISSSKSLKGDNVQFELYEPLPPLVTKYNDGTFLSPIDKSMYFYHYYLQSKDTGVNELNLGGNNITVGGDINPYGATVGTKGVVSSKYIIGPWAEKQKELNDKYDLQVQYLGDGNTNEEFKFSEQVNTGTFISSLEKGGSPYSMSDTSHVFNEGSYQGLLVTNKDIELNGNIDFDGLIISSGNININGKLNFKGAIVSGGDINIDGTAKFSYGESLVTKLIKENNLYKSVFANGSQKKYITVYNNSSGDTVDYNYSSLLEFSGWQIK